MSTTAIPPSAVAGSHDHDDHDHHHHHEHGEVNEPTWTDGKRYAWLLGLIVPVGTFLAWGLVSLTGAGIFWWGGPILIYVIIPLFDLIVGTDSENPPDRVLAWLEQDKYYRWATYIFIPLQFASLITACWLWTGGDNNIASSLIDKIGLMFTVGSIGGIAINTAHELGHKRPANEKWLSKIALAQTFYGHFFIEHNRGHHVRVATPEDPASSRMGQNFWQFLPGTVMGSLKSAWELESKRFERLGTSKYTLKNDILNAWLMSVVLFGGLIAIFGIEIAPYLIGQALFGFSLLEIVNYLEHYGLLRQKKDDGRYERCQPHHSWNSNNVVSNVFLYHLQRHSDHHAHPTRRYQALRHFDEAPQLPTGYAGLMVLAMFPPLWRRVMDHRVLEHYRGDITRASIHPRKRDKVIAKYGPGTKYAIAAEKVAKERDAEIAAMIAEAEKQEALAV